MKTFQKPLSKEEESLCIRALQDGDAGRRSEAKRLLIERNLRLVAHIARKYTNVDEDMEDLISIGTIGLIKAVDSFDLHKNSRLASYAARCIDNTILSPMRFYSRREPPVRDFSHAGRYFQNFLMKIILCAEQKTALYGTPLCVSIHSG